jgi:IS5 family transposase
MGAWFAIKDEAADWITANSTQVDNHPPADASTRAVRPRLSHEAYEQSRRERKKVEMRFAHMKRIFKLDRLRLRGLSGAKDEVLLTATAQNLRRLVKFLCRPPPSAAVTCAT